jgi:hypothetical protein
MAAAADEAEALGRNAAQPALADAERHLRYALELAYHLGQLAAVVELARTYEPPAAPARGAAPSAVDDPVSWLLIEPGWKVVDRDGRHVGSVATVDCDRTLDVFDGLRVRIGVLRHIVRVDAEHVASITRGRVQLDLRLEDL